MGSGQAARAMAGHVGRVIATDASERQIKNAAAHPRVEYRVAPAEQSGLDDHSVDMVTVAQALHWLDLDRFHTEVRRVVRPGGVVAAWCYALFSVIPDAHQQPGALELVRADLAAAWGDAHEQRLVSWPLHLHVGSV